jgi:hypothetical protein
MHITCTILVLICIIAIINQDYLHQRHYNAPTTWRIIGTGCQQDKPQIHTDSSKGHATAQLSSDYYSLPASHLDAIPSDKSLGYSTLTTHKFFSKLIVVSKQWKKPPPTRKNKTPNMSTHKQTEKARLQSEKNAAMAALKLQMEKGKLKRLEEKKAQDTERKQEEELRKKQRSNNANYKLQWFWNPRWYLLQPKWRKTGRTHLSTPIYRI